MCGVESCIIKLLVRFFSLRNQLQLKFISNFLTEYVSPQLEQYQPRVIFQQNGAPLHWGLAVRQFLNDTFPERWIGRDGPIP